MTRLGTAIAAIGLMTLAACDSGTAGQAEATAPEGRSATSSPDAIAVAGSDAAGTAAAPAYAAIYPGAVVEQPAVSATGENKPGGMVTFATDVDPETVVAFYREQAEQGGLSSLTALSQGETRAYSAAGDDGEAVQVVAAPDGEGRTSVQLTWSAGR